MTLLQQVNCAHARHTGVSMTRAGAEPAGSAVHTAAAVLT